MNEILKKIGILFSVGILILALFGGRKILGDATSFIVLGAVVFFIGILISEKISTKDRKGNPP